MKWSENAGVSGVCSKNVTDSGRIADNDSVCDSGSGITCVRHSNNGQTGLGKRQ